MYNQNRINLDCSVIYWECSRRKQLACKARVQTRCKSESYEIIQYNGKHNHSASKAIVDAGCAVSKLKNFVETGTTSKTRSIISDSIADLDNTAIAQLPSVPRLSRQQHGDSKC